ncbi:MAG: DUF488 domain-containing protein [Lactobacillales bacterium]|jgi:uncharacterized protein (DUF488 family)|nr:DUF488 domain-containing protein [Lactobacillales bacterium]
MKLFTIGFTQKSARDFFETLKENKIDLMVDVRINRTSQLAGFAKGRDLEYFMKEIVDSDYVAREDLAPTKELLKDYRDKKVSWAEYVPAYLETLRLRGTYRNFLKDYKNYKNVVLLCSEATAENCHRRLLAEKIKADVNNELEIIHL